MSTEADFRSFVLNKMELMDNELLALRAISGLLNGCRSADSVEPGELCWLLDPIIERQKALIEAIFELNRNLNNITQFKHKR